MEKRSCNHGCIAEVNSCLYVASCLEIVGKYGVCVMFIKNENGCCLL